MLEKPPILSPEYSPLCLNVEEVRFFLRSMFPSCCTRHIHLAKTHNRSLQARKSSDHVPNRLTEATNQGYWYPVLGCTKGQVLSNFVHHIGAENMSCVVLDPKDDALRDIGATWSGVTVFIEPANKTTTA